MSEIRRLVAYSMTTRGRSAGTPGEAFIENIGSSPGGFSGGGGKSLYESSRALEGVVVGRLLLILWLSLV